MEDKLLNSASTAVKQCLAVNETETVAIITDQLEREIAYALFEVCKQVARETIIVEIIPRQHHGEEPPSAVAKLMQEVDVIIAPTFRSLSHTQARRKASDSGVRIATMPGILRETFIRAMNVNYNSIAEDSENIAEMLSAARNARIITANGTDIAMKLEGRRGIADTGILHRKGAFGNLPGGEAYIAPIEKSASGTIVIDGAIGDTGVLNSDDYITIRVVDGSAREIDGGRAATYLASLLATQPKDARNIAEFGIGTNPSARLCGNILEDEKVRGTIHIALGDNASMGGNVSVPIHLDGIILAPTVYLDGKMIMERGKFKI
ncbi:aminopeptidase [bacterium]|nr:MAG: aminopeptidase [bacterium]